MMNSNWQNESAKDADKDFYYMEVFSSMTRNQRRAGRGEVEAGRGKNQGLGIQTYAAGAPAMSDNLLPCPFCRGLPVLDGKSDFVLVRCEDCGTKSRTFEFDADNDDSGEIAEKAAIKAWNRRA